ncbi:RNA polymerase sigma factor [Chitinophaga rhizophila]|uniref:Sigma-70 family RNA polymerase sigma factor n=1 Tax=Chitinophaga rhizophila TaxID=2866212 RepID=A0ABS7GFX6_9BACT|nr:sigma-70 family RNA polymerase sigma factor [Chitinophaga rhizophila]MBW8686316.1 sigma-70 family RNA polymerase sigma factor [Chitinophaga rhizophila]
MATTQPDILLDRIRNGEFPAFETLFNTYWEALYQYAARVTGSEADAQDLIQDLFTDIWERRETLHITTHIRHYLFSAARKMILRKFRDDGLKEKHLEKFVQYEDLRSELTMTTIIHKDIITQLHDDLNLLPEKERQVFRWYHFDELSIREIAQKNGTAEQTVRNQLNSAYRKAQGLMNKLLFLL